MHPLARNLGYLLSEGDTLLFIDDDLVVEPWIPAHALVFESNPWLGCLCPVVVTEASNKTESLQAAAAQDAGLK